MHRFEPYASANRARLQAAIKSELTYYSVDGSKYMVMEEIGHGTFGVVFKGCERNNPTAIVAMKQIMQTPLKGYPRTALREVHILKQLNHPNIVQFIELCRTADKENTKFYIVLKYCEYDLYKVMAADVVIKMAEKKRILYEILQGLQYMHARNIAHRDLKPQNILISGAGVLKLADFGSARSLTSQPDDAVANQPLSKVVVTLWYRSPELLLGDGQYGLGIDMWSFGCVLGQLWTKKPLLQGYGETDQIKMIMKLCGTISPSVWPGVEKLELYNSMELWQYTYPRHVREHLWKCFKSNKACDLLDKLLTLDPKGRIDANAALKHNFFPKKLSSQNLRKLIERMSTKPSTTS